MLSTNLPCNEDYVRQRASVRTIQSVGVAYGHSRTTDGGQNIM